MRTTTIKAPPGTDLVGSLEGHPVARERAGRRRLLIHDDALGWQLAALVLESTEAMFTVECPACPRPRLSRRRAPRRWVERVAVHYHGRSSTGPVQHRAAHHSPELPGYVVIDPLGILTRADR